jgi:hypothetical protein
MKCHACIKNAISPAFVAARATAVDVQQHIYIVTGSPNERFDAYISKFKQRSFVFLRLFELYKHWFECRNDQGYKPLYFCIVNGTEKYRPVQASAGMISYRSLYQLLSANVSFNPYKYNHV